MDFPIETLYFSVDSSTPSRQLLFAAGFQGSRHPQQQQMGNVITIGIWDYPLVNKQFAMENHHVHPFSFIRSTNSMAMFNIKLVRFTKKTHFWTNISNLRNVWVVSFSHLLRKKLTCCLSIHPIFVHFSWTSPNKIYIPPRPSPKMSHNHGVTKFLPQTIVI